jgi:hypothetical protein
MRLFLSSFVSSIAMLSLVASAARGDTAWLDVQGEASCIPDVSKLAERIEATLAGVKNPELAVRVTLQERERGTLASVSLLSGLRVAGEKQLVAPTCDETVDAVVMVVALALSSDSDTLDSDALDSEEPAGSMNGAAEDGSYRPQVVASARTLRWQRASPASVEQDAAPESNERDSPRRAMGAAGVDRRLDS